MGLGSLQRPFCAQEGQNPKLGKGGGLSPAAGGFVRTSDSSSFEYPALAAVGLNALKKTDRIPIEAAVDAYLQDAKSRELEISTLSKVETIFRKQFLSWATSEGYKFLDEIDLDALMSFRSTWSDGPLAKRKKQERMIGFF